MRMNEIDNSSKATQNICSSSPAQPSNSRKLTLAKVVARSSTSDKDPKPTPWNGK